VKSLEALKEKLKYNTEKLKIVSAFIIILTGSLIGLLFKNVDNYILKNVLLAVGAIIDILAMIYIVFLNNSIQKLLKTMDDGNI